MVFRKLETFSILTPPNLKPVVCINSLPGLF